MGGKAIKKRPSNVENDGGGRSKSNRTFGNALLQSPRDRRRQLVGRDFHCLATRWGVTIITFDPRGPEKSLESLQLSFKIKVLPFSAWIVFGPRFGTLQGTLLGAHLAPRHAETDLLGGLGPSKSRFQLLFWGPRGVQERSKRLPRGQRRPEQISRPPKSAPRSIWDQFGNHFG